MDPRLFTVHLFELRGNKLFQLLTFQFFRMIFVGYFLDIELNQISKLNGLEVALQSVNVFLGVVTLKSVEIIKGFRVG